MLSFALCDDNDVVLNGLNKMLESIFMSHNIDAEICIKTTNPNDILDYISRNLINVLILDIELKANISGLELAKKIRETNKNAYLIFTTGYLEYMMLAYKVKTFDFLPKPITYDKLEETVLRLLDDMDKVSKKYIKVGKTNTFISEEDIKYIQKDGMKLIFHTENRQYETYASFGKVASCLPDNFVRCHKSYIANINNIADVKANDNIILFNNDSSCTIGPTYKNKFMEVINND